MQNTLRLVRVAAALVALGFAQLATASFHLFRIEQIYSNADGTVQFVVLHESFGANGENFWAGQSLMATGGGATRTFTFPSNLPSSATAGRRVLVATQGFAALGIVTPDYVIPNGFLSTGAGSVNFANVDIVGYGSLPTDGVNAINHATQSVPNLATNFAGQSGSVAPPPPLFGNYQGLWWKNPPGSESGWGINLNHQGPTIFATWFTYGLDGKPVWYVVSAASTTANPNVFTGNLFTGTGPPFGAFDPAQVAPAQVGTATFTFTDANTAQFAYTVNGISQTKEITREVFDGPVPTCAFGAPPPLTPSSNFQDIWWRAPANSEPGWGINFAHQGDTIFASWFTFGADGLPLWFVVAASKTATGVYTGTLFRPTSGPPFNAVPFDPALVAGTAVGTVTLSFVDGNNASFDYTVDGVQQIKAITRQVFAPPGNTCQ
jgi:hypothetical protein